MKKFQMSYNHVDFNTWHVSGGNEEHLERLIGRYAYGALKRVEDAEDARDTLDSAVVNFMSRCEIEEEIASQWGLKYDGDACGGDGGFIDEHGDEYYNIHEHNGAGGWIRDASEEVAEIIAREMFAWAIGCGEWEMRRASIWAGFIRDHGSLKIYNRLDHDGYMLPGTAILEAAERAHLSDLAPSTIIALGALLNNDEKAELLQIVRNERERFNVAKALEVHPGYAMRRYRDRAAELVAARRDAHGWMVLAADTYGNIVGRTQCRTKADALREVSRRVIDIARQATQQFVMNGCTDID